ncbi:alpha/beta fold hydrolase [Rubrivivax sp. A210]|uniref:alpha/beta fold hydrolase n=1 Tax=Rubrivivax sp. A210 TaxID=2772301 RepID=UPI00191A2140|nr:alpha/beta fold hydrolase [Rubrivivax sp. A210]
MKRLALLGALAWALAAPPAAAAETRPGLTACRLAGVEHEAFCGSVTRPLDPARPDGVHIDVHFAVLPALARQRHPDPVFFFAGGPGQSAIALAGSVARLLARLSNRRDVVLVDLRGNGRSAPLACDEPGQPLARLAEMADPALALQRLSACRQRLQRLPHGDLRHYTTALAVQDVDAVRRSLAAGRINIVGTSYGTRVALDYMRQFPAAVRRAVLDGVVPPDMALPQAAAADQQAALAAVFAACGAEAGCRARHPGLVADWQRLLAGAPHAATVRDPLTGVPQTLSLGRDALLGLVRQPLYAPSLAAALPAAIAEAASGRFDPLIALAQAVQPARRGRVAVGLHYSVVCAEDVPRMAADAGEAFADTYRQACADWPRGEVVADFYHLGPAPAATLLLSGGADPVTPPRHGERVARVLGPRASHVVVAQGGHGLLALPCLRDVVFRFIAAEDEAAALTVDTGCASQLPRPRAFVPPTGVAP